MLRLRRIEIDNFVCFDDVVVEPSTDDEKRLTVIRAENGSGKTTFLRALRWGMYGENGLPGNPSRFSLHPAWWQPDDGGIKTKVAVEFETDGSTRNIADGNPSSTVYQLVRSVTTIGKTSGQERRARLPTHQRTNPADGSKKATTPGLLTPRESIQLSNSSFHGGSETSSSWTPMKPPTLLAGARTKSSDARTSSIRRRPQYNICLASTSSRKHPERVAGAARTFGAQATKANGDTDLNALQAELDTAEGGVGEPRRENYWGASPKRGNSKIGSNSVVTTSKPR